MRSAGPGGMRLDARARAERLWQETVARNPESSSVANGSNAPLLTPALSSPRGGEGEKAVTARIPSPPPSQASGASARRLRDTERSAERDRERWGKAAPRLAVGPVNAPQLPGGPATRKVRALWISAYHLGLVRDRSDAALVAWLHRWASVVADGNLTQEGLARAVPALEAWLARAAGVDWRPHLSLGRNGRVREIRRPRARVLEAQWRLLHRQGRVRIGSVAALGAYAARHAGISRADSHLALNDAQADALIRHLGKRIRAQRREGNGKETDH